MRTSNRMLNMAPNIAGHTDQVTKPDLEILYASTKLIICFFFKLECKKKFFTDYADWPSRARQLNHYPSEITEPALAIPYPFSARCCNKIPAPY